LDDDEFWSLIFLSEAVRTKTASVFLDIISKKDIISWKEFLKYCL
jgi:hypothetical protein